MSDLEKIEKVKELAISVLFVDGAHHKQKCLCEILKLLSTEKEYKELEIEDEGTWW